VQQQQQQQQQQNSFIPLGTLQQRKEREMHSSNNTNFCHISWFAHKKTAAEDGAYYHRVKSVILNAQGEGIYHLVNASLTL